MFKRLVGVALLAATTAASAGDFFDDTHLVDLKQGSLLSDKAYALRSGGYESAFGDKITFDKWYSTKWTDASIMFMTQVDKNFGVLWGGSTGERGEKYRIAPSFKLGFAYVAQPTKNTSLSIKAYRIFGGDLQEKTCTADYGDIGGIQQVNCRLAASTLTPQETLQYLVHQRPLDRESYSIQFNWNF